MKTHFLSLCSLVFALISPVLADSGRVVTVIDGAGYKALKLKDGVSVTNDGPQGHQVLKMAKAFTTRIDYKDKNIDPKDFDFIKLEIKADRGAFVRVGLENYPNSGDLSYWYVLDTLRGKLDWQTVWVDLKRPEEIKRKGSTKDKWRKGMAKDTESNRGINVRAFVKDLKNKNQGTGRNIWLGKMRFVKQVVALDWDQSQAPYWWEKGGDLIYNFPLQVSNKLNTAVTALLEIRDFQTQFAKAHMPRQSFSLAAGEKKIVNARLVLPAKVAANKEPLYCERFMPVLSAIGHRDSEVTVIRSSDPIHLSVTVPIPEEQLQGPMFTRPSQLPANVTMFKQEMVEKNAGLNPETLIENALANGLYQYADAAERVSEFRSALISSAMLFDSTGKDEYLQTAKTLALALPKIWKQFHDPYVSKKVRLISDGVVTRWGKGNHYTLSLGWLNLGTTRSPYYYGINGNGAGGTMSALAYAFEIIKPKLSEQEVKGIVHGYFLPAGIQARNHYVGDGNQQATANVTGIYAGILTRNWPLVSFGMSSEHGYHSILKWCFDDDGVQIRKNYQNYTIRPLFWINEIMYGCGINYYQKHKERFTALVHADTHAKKMGPPFEDHHFWKFVVAERMPKITQAIR